MNLKMQFEWVLCGKQAGGGGGGLCNNVQITCLYNAVPLFVGLNTALSKPLSLSSLCSSINEEEKVLLRQRLVSAFNEPVNQVSN